MLMHLSHFLFIQFFGKRLNSESLPKNWLFQTHLTSLKHNNDDDDDDGDDDDECLKNCLR